MVRCCCSVGFLFSPLRDRVKEAQLNFVLDKFVKFVNFIKSSNFTRKMRKLLLAIAVLGTLHSLLGVALAKDDEVLEPERIVCTTHSAKCGDNIWKPCCDLGQDCVNGTCQCSMYSTSNCDGLCRANPKHVPCCVTGPKPKGGCHCCKANQFCDSAKGCTCDLGLCGNYCASKGGPKTTPCCQDGKSCKFCGTSEICTDKGCRRSEDNCRGVTCTNPGEKCVDGKCVCDATLCQNIDQCHACGMSNTCDKIDCGACAICASNIGCLSLCNPATESCVGGICKDKCDGVVCPAGTQCQSNSASAQCLCTDSACSAQCDGRGVPCCTADLAECKCCPSGWNCASVGWGWRNRDDVASGNSSSVERAGVCTDPCSGVTCTNPGEKCEDGKCVCDATLCENIDQCHSCGLLNTCVKIDCGPCFTCDPAKGCTFQCNSATQTCVDGTCKNKCDGVVCSTGTQCDPNSGQCLCTDSTCLAQCNGQGVPCCTTDLKGCKCCPTGWHCAPGGWGWGNRDDLPGVNSSSVERAGVCADPCVGVTCPIPGDSCQDGVCKCDAKSCGVGNPCEACGSTGHCGPIECGECADCDPDFGCIFQCDRATQICTNNTCQCDATLCENIDQCHSCGFLNTCDKIDCGPCFTCDPAKGCTYQCSPATQNCVDGTCKDKCDGVVCSPGTQCDSSSGQCHCTDSACIAKCNGQGAPCCTTDLKECKCCPTGWNCDSGGGDRKSFASGNSSSVERAGDCTDPCVGVTCPIPGDSCQDGVCKCNPTTCAKTCDGKCNPQTQHCDSGCPGQCDEDGQCPHCDAEQCNAASCRQCNAQTGTCDPIVCPSGFSCLYFVGCVCTDTECATFCSGKGESCCTPNLDACNCCTEGKSCKTRDLHLNPPWSGNVSHHSRMKTGTCQAQDSCNEAECKSICGTCTEGVGCVTPSCPSGLQCDPGSGTCVCTADSCGRKCDPSKGETACCTADGKTCNCCPTGSNCGSGKQGRRWRSRDNFATGNSSSVERAGVCTDPCVGITCSIPGDSCQEGVCKCDSKSCGVRNPCIACGSTGHCGPRECGDCAKCDEDFGCMSLCDKTEICKDNTCQCDPTACAKTCGQCDPQTQRCVSSCPGQCTDGQCQQTCDEKCIDFCVKFMNLADGCCKTGGDCDCCGVGTADCTSGTLVCNAPPSCDEAMCKAKCSFYNLTEGCCQKGGDCSCCPGAGTADCTSGSLVCNAPPSCTAGSCNAANCEQCNSQSGKCEPVMCPSGSACDSTKGECACDDDACTSFCEGKGAPCCSPGRTTCNCCSKDESCLPDRAAVWRGNVSRHGWEKEGYCQTQTQTSCDEAYCKSRCGKCDAGTGCVIDSCPAGLECDSSSGNCVRTADSCGTNCGDDEKSSSVRDSSPWNDDHQQVQRDTREQYASVNGAGLGRRGGLIGY